jgi:hypothetical protein
MSCLSPPLREGDAFDVDRLTAVQFPWSETMPSRALLNFSLGAVRRMYLVHVRAATAQRARRCDDERKGSSGDRSR